MMANYFFYIKKEQLSLLICVHRAAIQGTTFPVIWIDNFSKNVARQRPTISKDVFTSMMWTGVAVKLYDGTALSRELVSVNGEQITAMPPTHAPLEANFISTSRASLPFEVGQPPMRFCDSLVNRYQVCSIPPKISIEVEKYAHLQQRLRVSRDGLHRTLPMDIWKHNIGSNTGLIDVIQEYVNMTDLNASTQYHVWLVDVNIYSRVYKVTNMFVWLFRHYGLLFSTVYVRSLWDWQDASLKSVSCARPVA